MNPTLRAFLSRIYNRTLFPRFYDLRQRAGGMLEPAVYHRIYREVRALPDLDIVEVGGASGAASVAVFWAMRDSGKRSQLIVVEKCEGGSRIQFGGREENLRRLQGHFEAFGAAGSIVLYPHALTFESGSEVQALIRTREIAAFLHDADGRIDRDFFLFWPRLRAGGLIVIDDFYDVPEFKPPSPRYPDGGTKSLLTFRLLNQFTEWGLFDPTRKVRTTMFGRKPPAADFGRFDLAVCDRIRAQVEQEHVAYLESHGIDVGQMQSDRRA